MVNQRRLVNPGRLVNPNPYVRPTRQVNGEDFPHNTLLATGIWDSLWCIGKSILGLCKTYYGIGGRGKAGKRKGSRWISEEQMENDERRDDRG